jgi:hypothetical protein
MVECPDDVEERAFAGAGGADDGDGLAGVQIEGDLIEDRDGLGAGGGLVAFGDGRKSQERGGHDGVGMGVAFSIQLTTEAARKVLWETGTRQVARQDS